MITNPRLGMMVQVWYRQQVREIMPLHGKEGTVRLASRGKPRNHLVEVEGKCYVVPCGNLRET